MGRRVLGWGIGTAMFSWAASAAAGTGGGSDDVPLVAIVVPVAFFLTLLGAVLGTLKIRADKDRERHETIRRMVEKGVEIPAGLVTPAAPPTSDLRRGLLLVSGGLGLSIFLSLLSGIPPRLWTVAFVPVLLGIGYLAVWRIESRGRGPASS